MLRVLILLVSLGAFACALIIGLSGPGAKFGFWEYGDGLGMVRKVAPFTLGFAGAAGLAFLLALWKARGLAAFALISALLAGAAGYVPLKMRELANAHPFIHDITTDFESPPQIIAAADLPRKNPPAYVGAEPAPREDEGVTIADAQRAAFPDIAPLYFDTDIDATVAAARNVLAAMKMETLAEGAIEEAPGGEGPYGWRIEAVYESTWYGFKDDFIVRIQPEESGRVRVDMRSKSRVGLSDLGANGARVRAFAAKLTAEMGS